MEKLFPKWQHFSFLRIPLKKKRAKKWARGIGQFRRPRFNAYLVDSILFAVSIIIRISLSGHSRFGIKVGGSEFIYGYREERIRPGKCVMDEFVLTTDRVKL